MEQIICSDDYSVVMTSARLVAAGSRRSFVVLSAVLVRGLFFHGQPNCAQAFFLILLHRLRPLIAAQSCSHSFSFDAVAVAAASAAFCVCFLWRVAVAAFFSP